ncbi:MAG TPA: hypothetical protein VFK05_09880 [Polyangiaceae bacterium]|nr:hypothetical protein [Polyangiaceae bacterium]
MDHEQGTPVRRPAIPAILDLEFHGIRCRGVLHDGMLGDRLRDLYAHAQIATPETVDLVVTVLAGTAVPARPETPTVSLIADRIIWGAFGDGRLVLSDGRSTARVDYAAGQATLELTERSEAAEYVATHRLFPIALSELLRTRAVYYLHAAAVANATGAVLFVGDSETGKSTLAYCAMRDGMKFIADDGVLLAFTAEGAAHVEAYYREFALDPTWLTAEERTRSRASEPMHTGDRRSRLIPRAWQCAPRGPVSAVLGIERTAGPSGVRATSRTELLAELLRQNPFVALNPELAPAHLSALGRLLRQVRFGVVESGPDVVGRPGAALALLDGWCRSPSI